MDKVTENLTIYYGTSRDGDIKAMIDELIGRKNSPYFKRRSRSEVARLVLISALVKEVSKYKMNESMERPGG